MNLRLGSDGLRRAWVRGQRLDPVSAVDRVEEAVAAVVGVQAQDLAAAGLAVRARTRGLVAADVWAAVSDRRSLVLTWSLRGTRHLHPAEDVRWILGLLGPRYARGSPGRNRQLGIEGAVGDRALDVVREALSSDGPLARQEIKDRLAPHGVDPHGQAPVHILRRAAMEGILCVLPPDADGGSERYVLLDDWATPGAPVDPQAAADRLARRYLAAFAPATPADFAAWSGLRNSEARQAWRSIGDDLLAVEEPRGTSWALRSGQAAMVEAAQEPSPMRLLAAFENLLLGYADRTPTLAASHARQVNAGGGLIRPTVIDDGRVVATWRFRRVTPSSPEVEVTVLEVRGLEGRLTRRQVERVEREADDIGRFLGADVGLSST